MKTFKVGDRVMCVDASQSHDILQKGKVYVVQSLDDGLLNLGTSWDGWHASRFVIPPTPPKSGRLMV